MADPCKRIAAWLFAAALLITVAGCTYPVLTAPAHTSRPQTTAANTSAISAVKPPRYQEAAIAAVVATPTPEPTVQPTAVLVAAPVYSGPSSDFEALLHAATTATWGEGEWSAMRQLILNESGMNPYAVNASSGACSAFQFLPCSKLGAPMSDFANQVSKGIDYIRVRYTNPTRALSYWYCEGWCINNYGGANKSSHWY